MEKRYTNFGHKGVKYEKFRFKISQQYQFIVQFGVFIKNKKSSLFPKSFVSNMAKLNFAVLYLRTVFKIFLKFFAA